MEIPSFYTAILFRHMCIAYDAGKDLYKLFADGEKVESGSWAGDNQVVPVR